MSSPLLHAPPLPPPTLAWLLGHDWLTRKQVKSTLFSAGTYIVYNLIAGVQVAFGLMAASTALWLTCASLLTNAVFYALARSGRLHGGRDPGLSMTQMGAGLVFLYLAYAAAGPAAASLTIVSASHIVYAMFTMTPRAVWRLVAASLAGLAVTMTACHLAWPERYPAGVQVVAWLYVALVVPMIATLASRITGMTQRLRSQRAELEKALAQVKEVATRDELTRTHNRAHMTELLQMQLAQHRRVDAPLSLALIDIDHFKHVNDRHGHATGDEVLRRFARRTQAQLRSMDVLARWGGEEFLVLLPHTPGADAVQALDRLQRALADDALADTPQMPHGLVVSFSAGVVQVRRDDTVDSAIERADQAMYRAKHGGRARCVAG